MAGDSTSASQGQPLTIFGLMMHWLGKLIAIVVISAFFSILVEWIMISVIRDESIGAKYIPAKEMFEYEVQFIQTFLSTTEQTASSSAIVGTAQLWMAQTIHYIFIDSGFLGYFQQLHVHQPNEWKITRYFKNVLLLYSDYMIAAIYVLMMYFVRLTILLLSMPIFLLFAIVGFADGLMQRDLRRWTAGTESGYIYHLAKRFAGPTVMLGALIYLSSPYSVNPNYVIVPTALAFGCLVMLMASKFKKYL